METWFKGRTLLVGDAAHALLPQSGMGCNMAIEDGEALAYFLENVPARNEAEDADEQMKKALERFVEARRERTDMVGRIARQIANIPSQDDINRGKISINDLLSLYLYEGIESSHKLRPSRKIEAVACGDESQGASIGH